MRVHLANREVQYCIGPGLFEIGAGIGGGEGSVEKIVTLLAPKNNGFNPKNNVGGANREFK